MNPYIVKNPTVIVYTCCECNKTALVTFKPNQQYQEEPAGWEQLYEWSETNQKNEITDNYKCGYCRLKE